MVGVSQGGQLFEDTAPRGGGYFGAISDRNRCSKPTYKRAPRSRGPTTNSASGTRLGLFNLRPHILLVTLRTIAVTELRLGSCFDITLDRFPSLRRVPDAFAVGTNRKQPLELLHMLAQAEDALRRFQARLELVHVDRLGDEIVGARFHAFEVTLLAARRPDQEEVGILVGGARPQSPTQLCPVDFWHRPI